jgi:hypothetical protein
MGILNLINYMTYISFFVLQYGNVYKHTHTHTHNYNNGGGGDDDYDDSNNISNNTTLMLLQKSKCMLAITNYQEKF